MKNYKITDTDVLIIGSGTGAVSVASELLKKNRFVTIVEQGRKDDNFGTGFRERATNIYHENGELPKSDQGIKYYRHLGYGGTIEISCGNGILPPEEYLNKIGVDINDELDEISEELKITPVPDSKIGSNTRQLMNAASNLSLDMVPTPKFIDFDKCNTCAKCEVICQNGAKWSVAEKLDQLSTNDNLQIITGVKIDKIEFEDSIATGAVGIIDKEEIRIKANTIILAAGGLGTPIILQNSGIEAGHDLHMDLYVAVYGKSEKFKDKKRDLPMAAIYSHPDNSFIIAPYIDPDLWFALSEKNLSSWLNGKNLNGLMVKMSDQGSGQVMADGTIKKHATEKDKRTLNKGIELSKQILIEAGADEDTIITTSICGAHPAGTAAIGKVVNKEFRVNQFDNLFVSDASLLPHALGKPPILTIMGLAKYLGKRL